MAQQPNLVQGPDPVETGELHFKLYCKLKVFEAETKYEKGHCCILAVSQYYGLIFVGNCNGFSVIKTKSLSPAVDLEKFPKRNVTLNLRPTHLSVDFSQKILAVVCSSKPGSVLIFYNIQSFGCKDVTPLKIVPVAKLTQNLTAEVVDVTWQPNVDGSLMICLSDGSVVAFSQGVKDGPMFTLPSTTRATCFCWSPKGKQIVIGSASGTLSQYKPDLKVVKSLPPPPLYNGGAMVVNVLWISSYQFAVAYNDRANPESFPVITIVNAAKNEPVNVINYDDITYSTTLFRNHQMYMSHQSAWNLIFVSSANSIEVAVLHSKDGSSWTQWLLGDASRAELPLDSDRQETFPLGLAFDFTSQEVIPWGEGTLPPMPRLLLVSDEGLLCVFNIVNAMESPPQLCAPPKENLDDSLFVVVNKTSGQLPFEQSESIHTKKSLLGSPPVFGNSKPTYSFEASPGFGKFEVTKLPSATPVVAHTAAPVAHTAAPVAHTAAPVATPVATPIAAPVATPIAPPVATPIAAPVATPIAPPVATPIAAPVATPIAAPVATPIAAPIVAPIAAPAFAPVTTPAAATIAQVTHPIKKDLSFFTSKNLPHFTSKKEVSSLPKSEISFTSEKPVAVPASVCKSSETTVLAEKAEVTAHGESPIPGTPELTTVDDSVYLNALQEEIEHFNSELQQLSTKVSNLDIIVGTEEDKAKMKKSIDGLYDFWKELKETTEGQSGEIHAVVMDLMEAFAWLEDAKSRNLQRKNPSYIELKKSEELDPLSARHMNEIAHLKYYIENQLKQLTRYLEKEWMDYQENYRNEVKNKMAVPPLEEVYKTMHFQLKILHKQKALVEELKERIAVKKRKIKSQSFINCMDNSNQNQNCKSRVSELSKLAENLLQLKINKEENSPRTGTWEMMKMQLSAISERSKKLTLEKQTALREALSECDTVKIRPVKTTLESSSFVRSLALEKATPMLAKLKSSGNLEESKKIDVNSSAKTDIFNVSKIELEAKSQPEPEKPKISKKRPAVVTKSGTPKSDTPSVDKTLVPLTVQSLPKQEEKSPLDMLSGIVSNIGKKDEIKSPEVFVYGNMNLQKSEPPKGATVFGSQKPEQNEEESNTSQVFMFTIPKPTELVARAKDSTVEDEKPPSSFSNSTLIVSTSLNAVKLTQTLGTSLNPTKMTPTPSVTITPITTTPSTTAPSQFILTPDKTTTNSPNLPIVKSLFSGKKQSPEFGTPITTTGSLFFSPSTTIQTSASSIFGTASPIFGVSNKNTTTTFGAVMPSLSATPKTSSEAVIQPSNFTFTLPVENKSTVVTSTTIASPIKSTSETEEVDVEKVDEPGKKQETPSEKSKDSPKGTALPSVFTSSPAPASTIPEVTVTSFSSPNVSVTSALQTSVGTASVFAKPAATSATIISTPSSENSSISSPAIASCSTTATTKIASPIFSFSTTTTPVVFGSTVTTTTATITSSPFGTSTSITSVFGQVSSTAPSTNIFGGSVATTITGNIFGGSTPAKPTFTQAATPSTTSESIFKAPMLNTFGQVSPSSSAAAFSQVSPPPSTASTTTATTATTAAATTTPAPAVTTISSTTASIFGQVSTSPSTCVVAQTANLFDQILSDNNQSIFGTSSTISTTTANVFNSPKNLFGDGRAKSTTTTSLFGTTSSSIFQKTTSIFGHSTTSSSLFGQSQTFFGQNICSPFGSGTSVTSNQNTFDTGGFNKPIFGQSAFGQSTSNTSIFGGSSSSTLFRGTSSTTTSNVFQTATTTSTFGSTSSEPFSNSTGSFGTTASSFQKSLGGFGSPPVFGGGPAFGSSATFGGSPSFGSLPSFGSMSQETFGQTTGSTTFENLANQNTVGFGNLAQQSQSQGFGGGFGSPTFENKAAFGSTSFSSWRSK